MIDKLVQFGLTRQEATIYLYLLRNKELSGYEVAKNTGISRSNVYSALAALVDEGAAYLLEGETNKYMAVSVEDFCQNRIRHLTELKTALVSELPQINDASAGYVTISNFKHIMDKIYNMLEHVEYRVYIEMPVEYVEKFRIQLEKLISDNKKVVLLINKPLDKELEGCIIYITGNDDRQLKIIVDSSYVLTGEITGDVIDSCLYCGQKNFVKVFKDSLRNEIKLIEMCSRNIVQ